MGREPQAPEDRPGAGGWLPPESPGPPPDLGGGPPKPPDLERPEPPPQQPPAWHAPPQQPPVHPPPPGTPPPATPGTPPAGTPPPGAPPPGQPGAYGWHPAYGQHPAWPSPPVWNPYAVPDTGPGNGQAVAGFVLGLSAVALLSFSFGLLFVLALPCAVLAIVFGRKGKRRVDDGETHKHRGIAQAGYIMGIVTLILSLLAAAGWIAIIASDDDFFEDPGDGLEGFDSVLAPAVLAVRIAALVSP